jgi:oxygen-independent coproporphyrinogen-3 oxidase
MLGVYISVPFCAQKCTFCNFRSGVFPAGLLAQYLAALEAELAAADWTTLPDTLYVGGGTPSLLDPAALERILRLLPARAWREATIEASPGTVTAGRAEHWRSLGLDRVSLGVQSFVEREIRAAARKHDAALVEAEIALLRRAGLANLSIDLIAGLPYQTPESWRQSLEWIERLGPLHVSVYMFESDENSRLGRELEQGGARYGAQAVPEEGQVADFYVEAAERLDRAGWRRYEISNFARPGFESLHNLKYWRQQTYRGFGADAHSFDASRRWGNVKTAAEYVERFRSGLSPVDEIEPLDAQRRMEEHFFLGLRQTAGIEPAVEEWRRFADPIRRLSNNGLLACDGPRLRLTDRGILFSNEVFAEFLA